MIKNIKIAESIAAPLTRNKSGGYDKSATKGSLAGKFLVASPSLQESCFTRAVIYMCVHDESGAMGIIVNYPIENIKIDDIMEQVGLKTDKNYGLPVHFGGPVESNRGFIVHSDKPDIAGIIAKYDGIAVSSNIDILQNIIDDKGPDKCLISLGYAGWTAGQLESEMESGSWIVVSATQNLLFDTENEMKWELAIASLGFDVGNFSNSVGHA
ncbi:MAG: YqgE/AlgH family protein [Rickettsiales bacterium]